MSQKERFRAFLYTLSEENRSMFMTQEGGYATSNVFAGLGGSHLHGLATPESDEDWFAVIQRPTTEWLGLTTPKDKSISLTDPDMQVHELGKFVSLALKGNPTVLECLFAPNLVFFNNPACQLIPHRHRLVGSRPVASAYLGYATAQQKRFVPGTHKKAPEALDLKRKRHAMRLVLQAQDLLETGDYSPTLDSDRKEWLLEFVESDSWDLYNEAVDRVRELEPSSSLPKEPDFEFADGFMMWARMHNLWVDMELPTEVPLLGDYVDL